ncbi:kinase-like protein [Rhizophagus irregularis]|uniref:Kinase-like domain-containing protein n=5 Tax=Rhizophagus irregularis TaxID=588596 RepID=U9UVN4_RHIID|nr:kinase-like domain-containing protein [Rhizophagus irregularis DAOM 181602=DAOM 197198]XP_025164461.1 kinase-like domain-containing protein [Rhizophagus irregularis DAOM 181602=DAOM 197198]PKC13330.1 kinase-like protein [Rhizophagus irregularis]PKY46676.1 kinase-like protein [Rhizophagus irregularis]POG57592.1 kinase-like domain-containing protein [Rhizophagus irregularis DAOM 181602=DAOM 197198]POG57595.1 kinase-like domain-containing protein [Rhizophagus irregularis DAOM 181602=DAOM 19719|eukprot:XP_025164458.1 kinase-like domain-containing protein [Rhizophagus irregularis DAOM 181602=DAOM 197198]
MVVACKYKTGKILGAGTYTVVKEAQYIKTKQYFAVKIINKKTMEGRWDMIVNELNILKNISQGHRYILTLVDYFESINNFYIVTDRALGGDLNSRICQKGSYFERNAINIVRNIIEAVKYLHDKEIVHRNLKPENIIFRTQDDESDILICGFHLSRIIDSDILNTICGAPGYMAPEIFGNSGYSKPIDLWSIGVITYFILCGFEPFGNEGTYEEIHDVLRANYNFNEKSWKKVSDTAKDFINKLLVIDPDSRLNAYQALAHPWLTASSNFNSRKGAIETG